LAQKLFYIVYPRSSINTLNVKGDINMDVDLNTALDEHEAADYDD
jgi:hypothetical protein